eukprot:scaffold284904_cov31-Tisochrysis_lutea.AAC.1
MQQHLLVMGVADRVRAAPCAPNVALVHSSSSWIYSALVLKFNTHKLHPRYAPSRPKPGSIGCKRSTIKVSI